MWKQEGAGGGPIDLEQAWAMSNSSELQSVSFLNSFSNN